MSDLTRSPALVVTAPASLRGLVVKIVPGRSGLGRYGDTPLDAVGVSRNHAWIDEESGMVWITDNNSTNGTFVNGARITVGTRLSDGDQVAIGDVRLTAHLATGDWTRPATAPIPDATTSVSQVTRYLCAGVHQDRRFREHVIDEVVNQPYRAICPSYGVDLVAVVRHALAAQRQRMLRDVALVVLLVAALIAGAALNSSSSALPILVVIGLLSWLVVGFDSWWRRYIVLAGGLSQNAPHPRDPDRPRSARLARRLDAIARVQSSNVLVFSGFTPFVGSGIEDERWAFAIDTEKGAKDPVTGRRKTPKPFSAGDLYAALTANIATVGLPNLRVGERLLINGVDVRQIPELLPNRLAAPVGFAAPEVLHGVRNRNRGVARTYLCLEVTGWRGQLVVTIFLRAVRLQGSLYLEWTSYVLLPLPDEYYAVDRLTHRLGASLATALGEGLVSTPLALVGSPVMVLHRLNRWFGAWRSRSRQRDQILANRNFDYGARTSIREEAMGESFRRYFVSLDSEMYTKVIQLRLLKHIFDFLELHDLDTSDFAAQQTNINNSHTYNVSGNVGPGAAFGQHAQGGNKSERPPAAGAAK